MKKRILAILFLVVSGIACLVALSGCVETAQGTNISFTVRGDTLYVGHIFEAASDGDYFFMPMRYQNMYVVDLGATYIPFYSTSPIVTSTLLSRLYCPGSIGMCWSESNHPSESYYVGIKEERPIEFYHCGGVIDLRAKFTYYPCPNPTELLKVYVPSADYDEFVAVWGTDDGRTTSLSVECLQKANVVYNLNTKYLPKYYYVDYVQNGTKIRNLPPDPERDYYEFGGWYLDKQCQQKWDSESVISWDDSQEFFELNLYAKWIHIEK